MMSIQGKSMSDVSTIPSFSSVSYASLADFDPAAKSHRHVYFFVLLFFHFASLLFIAHQASAITTPPGRKTMAKPFRIGG
jgi:hypothetical protein